MADKTNESSMMRYLKLESGLPKDTIVVEKRTKRGIPNSLN